MWEILLKSIHMWGKSTTSVLQGFGEKMENQWKKENFICHVSGKSEKKKKERNRSTEGVTGGKEIGGGVEDKT